METRIQVRMPWEPRSDEPPLAYARFRLYLELGPSRSLAQAADAGGLSVARLKQLSVRWQWPLRAVAWDEHQFRERCHQELEAQVEAQARLLKESADWQRLARAELNAWVRRRADGEYELARPLTAGEAIRLWHLGCLVERRLRGLQAAALPAPDRERERAHTVERMRQAQDEMVSLCQRAGADFSHHEALRKAFVEVVLEIRPRTPFPDRRNRAWAVQGHPGPCATPERGFPAGLLAWITWYGRAYPDGSFGAFARLWPWDLPLQEPS